MRAKDTFDESIEEVNFLNSQIKDNLEEDKIYFKVIILLLCAKLEKYVKDSAKEYISELINLKLTNEKLPKAFVNEIIKNEVEKIRSMNIENYVNKEQYKNRSRIFSLIWNPKYVLEQLNDEEFAISISSNGTNALEDAYKKIGFHNMINTLKDYKQDDLYSETSYSIKDNINSVIKIRHQIIHEDATPLVTSTEIKLYVDIFKDFVNQVDHLLSENIENLKNIT